MSGILFIGGTGLISNACTNYAAKNGLELTVLNRGKSTMYPLPKGVRSKEADIHDQDSMRRVLQNETFDVVVDWIAYTEAEIRQRVELLQGKLGQYVFISSASAYQKPPRHYIVTEETPLENPFNEYSRNKIAAEAELMKAYREDGFPGTIVRPSSTYGPGKIPVLLNSWMHPYTIIERIRKGKQVIIPGDGTSLWVPTWNEDFATGFIPLLGLKESLGQAYHITSDEVLTWNQVYEQLADAAGKPLQAVHIAADFISSIAPEETGALMGDRSHSLVFDNRKVRALVPGFDCKVSWAEGMRCCVAWHDADPARQNVDAAQNEKIERILAAYNR